MSLKNRYKYFNIVSHAERLLRQCVESPWQSWLSVASPPQGCSEPSTNADALEEMCCESALDWKSHSVPYQQSLNRWQPLRKVLDKDSIVLRGWRAANCAQSFRSSLLKQVKSFSGNMIISSLFRRIQCLCSLAFIEVIERLHPPTRNQKKYIKDVK